jgi:hypothetical protein
VMCPTSCNLAPTPGSRRRLESRPDAGRRSGAPTASSAASGADMVFVTAGLGGGTGTEPRPWSHRWPGLDALTVAVVPRRSVSKAAPHAPAGWIGRLAATVDHDRDPQRSPARPGAAAPLSSSPSKSPTTCCARRCRASATSSSRRD